MPADDPLFENTDANDPDALPNPWDRPHPDQDEQGESRVVDGSGTGDASDGVGSAADLVSGAADLASGVADVAGGTLEVLGGCADGCGGCSLAVLVTLFAAAGSAMAFFR